MTINIDPRFQNRDESVGAANRRRPNLKDTVADHLRQRIFSGEMKPGDRIDQDAVATELGVSKLPVREALITLESEALIVNVARKGSYVAPLDPDDIRDHYRIYGMVSAVAARRAAAMLDEDGIRRLEALVDRMEELSATPDALRSEVVPVEESLNFELHRIINQAGGSRRLLSVLHLLSQAIPSHFYDFTAGWAATAVKHHREIVEALREGDGDRAATAMASHLEESGELAVKMLETSGFWNGREEDLEE